MKIKIKYDKKKEVHLNTKITACIYQNIILALKKEKHNNYIAKAKYIMT